MQTIESVEQQIELNQELLSETKKRFQETATKLSTAKEGVKRIESEIKDLKEKRQQVLVKGGDAKGLSDSLKKLEAEQEIEQETVVGLQKFLSELQTEERELHFRLNELPKRSLQLQSVELAKKFNQVSAELAELAKELNAVHYKLDTSGNNGKQARTVFLPDGIEYLDKIVRLTFDDEALNLDDYIRKNVTCLPYNPGDEQKYFYKWETHKQDLINKKG